ncbi:MAG: aminotransferase class I/II-fold pyridoxal phosphate-dependent enzyme [Clostridiales bacterium]|nr:aminotransferase class I/II-fold pyridoxal phosphate-dependent enzyme [Clostridiales bacterium]
MNWQDKLSNTVINIKPSGIRKFFDIVQTMPDAISLGVGEPDFITPWHIRQAAMDSIRNGETAYTSNAGDPKLRKAISRYIEERFSLSYDPMGEIIVTVGASEAIDLAMRALINPGDEVIIPDPSYVSYVPNVLMVHGVPVPVKTKAENDFRITPNEIEAAITDKTKAIILPYPNNPTGAVMEKHHLEEIAKVIKKHDLIVISDEIYAELSYGINHISIASIDGMKERTILINGFSKAFAMTGWRVGFVCAPKDVLSMMLKVHQYVIMCASTMSQAAALDALERAFVDGFKDVKHMQEDYDMRRRVIYKALNEMGLSSFEPKGAFYIFPCIKSTNRTSEQFATDLLKSQHVAVVPGTAFGESGEGYVRCSYASSLKNINEAMDRIKKFLESINA